MSELFELIKNNKNISPINTMGDISAYNNLSADESLKRNIRRVSNELLLSTDLTRRPSIKLDDSYIKAGVYQNDLDTEEDYNKIRANSQSAVEQARNSLIQLVGNEIILGTVKAFSDIADAGINLVKYAADEEQKTMFGDYTNPISQSIENVQNDIREKFAIYRENPNVAFDVTDFGWWADNFITVGSTASLLIPGLGVAKGVGFVNKIPSLFSKGATINKGLVKLSKGVNGSRKALFKRNSQLSNESAINRLTKGWDAGTKYTNRATAMLDRGSEIFWGALASRTAEGYMESREVYNSVYESALQRLQDPNNKELKEELIKRHPQFEGKTDEEIAKAMAGLSAEETFKKDFYLLAFDMMQFKALGKLWNGGVKGSRQINTATTRLANRNSMRQLAGESGDKFETMNFWQKRLDNLKHPTWESLAILSEAPEEMWQGSMTERGKEVAEIMFDPTINRRTIDSYLTDPHIWEQGFWGVLGGKAFQSLAHGINKVSAYINTKKNKDRFVDDYNDWLLSSEEKVALESIEHRKNLFDDLQVNIKNITDKVAEGKISEEEGEILKEEYINNYITDLTLDASNSGTYDLLKDYLSDERVQKTFVDAGLFNSNAENILTQKLLKQMENVQDVYSQEMENVLNSIDVDNPYVAEAVASYTTRLRLNLDKINNALFEENKLLDEYRKSQNFDTYQQQEEWKFWNNVYENLNKEFANTVDALQENKLSKQAFNQLNEDVKQYYEAVANKVHNFETIVSTDVKPTDQVQQAISRKLNLENKKLQIENELPTNKKQYEKLYLDNSADLDKITKKRFEDAYDKLIKWFENQKDLDTAISDIYQDNVPELKRELDILKLGYGNKAQYAQRLMIAKLAIEEERKKVNINGKPVDETEGATVNEDLKDITEQVDTQTNNTNQTNSNQNNKKRKTLADIRRENRTKPSNNTNQQVGSDVVPVDVPSTGEEVRDDSALLKDEIHKVEQQIDEQTQLAKDSEELAKTFIRGEFASTVAKIFISKPELFTSSAINDIDSEDYKKLFNAVKDQIEFDTNKDNIPNDIIESSIASILQAIARQLKKQGKDENTSKLLDLHSKLITKLNVETSDNKLSSLSLITDNDYNQILEEYFKSYLKIIKSDIKSDKELVIDLIDFFDYLFSNDNFGVEDVIKVLTILKDNINNLSNFKFLNTNILNKDIRNVYDTVQTIKSKRIKEDRYFHISPPSREDGQKRVNAILPKLRNGEKLTYSISKNGEVISIKYNNIELGYIVGVTHNSTNNRYKLVKILNDNFNIEVWQDEDGIHSNIDEFITKIISDKKSKLKIDTTLGGVDRYCTFEDILLTILNENNRENIEDLQKEQFIRNNLYNILLNNGLITKELFHDTAKSNDLILKRLQSIIGYVKSASYINEDKSINTDVLLKSYNNYIAKRFNNFRQTYNLVLAANEGKPKIITYRGSGHKEVLFNNEKLTRIDKAQIDPIGNKGKKFTYESNPLVIVNENNQIYNEKTGELYKNPVHFMSGTFGLLLEDNPTAPLIAVLNQSSKVSECEISNDVKTELNVLFEDYQNGKLKFNDLYNDLVALLGNSSTRSKSLFIGVDVVKANNKIYINIKKNDKSNTIAIISQNKEKTSFNLSSVDAARNVKTFTKYNKEFADKIINNLLDNLYFNKTFYTIKTKEYDANKKYFKRGHNNIIIEIGGNKRTYNNFGEFIIQQGAFYTNHVGYKYGVDLNSLYIGIEEVQTPSPVEGFGTIKIPSKNTTLSIEDLWNDVNGNEDVLDTLLDNNNVSGISLLPKTINYVGKRGDAYALYEKKTNNILITKRGLESINQKGINAATELQRLLLHERLHQLFEDKNLFEREYLVDELLKTHAAFINAINNDTTEVGETLRKWVNNGAFTSARDYVNKIQPNNTYTDEQANRIFAEEWLVESLSQGYIMNYLNTINYNADITDNAVEQEKSIWQKIIELLLNLFGKTTKNIKNNTILAKHYLLLGNQTQDKVIDSRDMSSTDITTNSIEDIEETAEEFDEDLDAYLNEDEDTDDNYDEFDKLAITNSIEEVYPYSDMQDYLMLFPSEERSLIEREMNAGRISFMCK